MKSCVAGVDHLDQQSIPSVRVVAVDPVRPYGLQKVDGVDLRDGDAVLRAGEQPSDNGVWIARAGAWEMGDAAHAVRVIAGVCYGRSTFVHVGGGSWVEWGGEGDPPISVQEER